MKLLLILIVFFGGIYFYLSVSSGERMYTTYCARKVQNETQRVYKNGLRVRDKNSEKENLEVCLEEVDGKTMLEMIVLYLTPLDIDEE